MRERNPGAYRELIRAEVDDLFRLAWIGTDFAPNSKNQALALERVQGRIERISDPGVKADLIQALDERTRGQIGGQVERSVEVNLMAMQTGAVQRH